MQRWFLRVIGGAALIGLLAASAAVAQPRSPDWIDCAGADLDRAIRGCGAIIAAARDKPAALAAAYYNRANARLRKGDAAAAITDYGDAVRLDPTHASAFYNRSIARARAGDAAGAGADYDRALSLDPRFGSRRRPVNFAPERGGHGARLIRVQTGANVGAGDADLAAAQRPINAVTVYFATNRGRDETASGAAAFSSDRVPALTYGSARVSIPPSHKPSAGVERPWLDQSYAFTDTLAERADTHFTLIKDGFVVYPRETDVFVANNSRDTPAVDFAGHALVFVHGYDNSLEEALYRAAQFAYDLRFDGPVFLFSWPSVGGLSGAFMYRWDEPNADQSGAALQTLIERVMLLSGASRVHLVAHSMGNRPLVAALGAVDPSGGGLAEVVLAAPDVTRPAFADTAPAIVRRLAGAGGPARLTLVAASNDRALALSSYWHGNSIIGYFDPATGPTIEPGVDTIDISVANARADSGDTLALNHGGFAEDEVVLADLRRLLLTGQRPHDTRNPKLRKVSAPGDGAAAGFYWALVP